MQRVAAGDQAAFGALFDRYQVSLCRFAYRFVGSAARAEELAQDIFVKLYASASRYQPSASFKTFLFRVATNHCLNELRRGEYQRTESLEANPDAEGFSAAAGEGERPDQSLDGRELERAVGLALAELSERERAAFVMCRFEGMAYREIAEALPASEAAVKSLIHRATLAVARKIDSLNAGQLPARSKG